jgi:hypothetical protein
VNGCDFKKQIQHVTIAPLPADVISASQKENTNITCTARKIFSNNSHTSKAAHGSCARYEYNYQFCVVTKSNKKDSSIPSDIMRSQNNILSILILSIILAVSHGFTQHSSSTQKKAFTTTSLSSTATMVEEVKVGDKIPSIVLKEGQADYGTPVDVNIADFIKGKKVAIFAVPGAFTPGCSKSHLPSFIEAKEELKAKGIECIICIATNDAFVMEVRNT